MNDIKKISNDLRKATLKLCHLHNASHIGSSLSVIDILSVLYSKILNLSPSNINNPSRDRVFYSKGHAAAGFYATLDYFGFLKKYNLFEDYTKNGSLFTSHINHKIPGVEISTGSLGHALPISLGVAKALKIKDITSNVYTIISDGELQEGSNWESILLAPKHELDNLFLIIDYNKIQSFGRIDEIAPLDPLVDKFKSFNWEVMEIDGHNHEDIHTSLKIQKNNIKPKVIIAHTIKGKGVDFMEDKLEWHYKSPNSEQFKKAVEQLNK